jgi:hypothetical protein
MKKIIWLLFLIHGFLNINCYSNNTFRNQEATLLDNQNYSKEGFNKDTFPKQKIYAQYGDIILNQHVDPGHYRYISEDESIQIDQPWDGILIYNFISLGTWKIEFYDKDRVLKKTIDMESLNPYTKAKYPKMSEKIGLWGEDEFFNGIMDKKDKVFEITEYRRSMYIIPQDDYFRDIRNTNKHIVLHYNLIPMNANTIVGWESTLIILDSIGKEISRLEGLKYDCKDIVVSTDGKYLGFIYGNTMDNEFSHLFINEGINIYDLSSKQIIYNEKSESRGGNPTFGLSVCDNGMLRIFKNYQDKTKFDRSYKFIDCNSKILYEKEFSTEELKDLSKCKTNSQLQSLFQFNQKKFLN